MVAQGWSGWELELGKLELSLPWQPDTPRITEKSAAAAWASVFRREFQALDGIGILLDLAFGSYQGRGASHTLAPPRQAGSESVLSTGTTKGNRTAVQTTLKARAHFSSNHFAPFSRLLAADNFLPPHPKDSVPKPYALKQPLDHPSARILTRDNKLL